MQDPFPSNRTEWRKDRTQPFRLISSIIEQAALPATPKKPGFRVPGPRRAKFGITRGETVNCKAIQERMRVQRSRTLNMILMLGRRFSSGFGEQYPSTLRFSARVLRVLQYVRRARFATLAGSARVASPHRNPRNCGPRSGEGQDPFRLPHIGVVYHSSVDPARRPALSLRLRGRPPVAGGPVRSPERHGEDLMDHRRLSQMDRNLAVEAQPPRQPANRAAAWLATQC
jgi:hypothetical protein